MIEGLDRQLSSLKTQFEKNIDSNGDSLTEDQKAIVAANIAQLEFIRGDTYTGISFLDRALKYPVELHMTDRPNLSQRTHLITLATYELLDSLRMGFFAPSDATSIHSLDVRRIAGRIEKSSNLSVMELKDVLFARFANAIVVMSAAKRDEDRNAVVSALQETINSINKRFPGGANEIGEREQIRHLVDLFNQTNFGFLGTYQGEQIPLVTNLFRAYQGLPVVRPNRF